MSSTTNTRGIHREFEVFEPQSASLDLQSSPDRRHLENARDELWVKYETFLTKRLDRSLEADEKAILKYLLENLKMWPKHLQAKDNNADTSSPSSPVFASATGPDVQMLFFKNLSSWMKDSEERRKVLKRCFHEGTFLNNINTELANPQEPSSTDAAEQSDDNGYTTLTAALEAQQQNEEGIKHASTTMEAAEPEPDGSLDLLGDLFLDEERQIPVSQLAPINWVHQGTLYNVARGRSGWHMDRDGTDEDHGGYTLTLSENGSSTQWLPCNVFPAVARLCSNDIARYFSSSHNTTEEMILKIRARIQQIQVEFLFEVDSWLQRTGLIQVIPPGTILADYSCFNKLFHRTNMDVSSDRIFLNISETVFRELCVAKN